MPTVQSKLFMRHMLALAACAAAPAPSLVRLEATGLTVVCDAGEAPARALVDRLLEMKQAFPIGNEAGLTLFVLTDRKQFARLRPAPSAVAFFQRSAGERYIVLSDPASAATLRHEFVHFALDQAAVTLPVWLEEGLAEYYSTLEARRDHLVAGRPVDAHLARLRSRLPPDLRSVLRSPAPLPVEHYPLAWAFVHMLQHEERYAPRFGAFWQRLQQGEPPTEELLAGAFARGLPAIEADLRAYLQRPAFDQRRIGLPGPIPALARVQTSAVTADEFDLHYLALARAMGRPDAVDAVAERAAGRGSPGAQAIAAAYRATSANRREDAIAFWEQAIAAGPPRADVYFEYAGALRDRGSPESDVADALARVLELQPRYTPANLWLAAIEGRRGRWAVAETLLAAAAAETPRRFEVWYELAFARRELGQAGAAHEAARKALAVAVLPQDREKAAALAASTAPPASRGEARRPATSAKGWERPAGDRQVEGEWVELVCGEPAVLRLAGGEEFRISDPAQVTLKNAGGLSVEFKCGKQEPARRLRLGYDSATREVRTMEWLDPA